MISVKTNKPKNKEKLAGIILWDREKLVNADKHIQNGNNDAACGILFSFINELDALRDSGKLSLEQVDPLKFAAGGCIFELCGD